MIARVIIEKRKLTYVIYSIRLLISLFFRTTFIEVLLWFLIFSLMIWIKLAYNPFRKRNKCLKQIQEILFLLSVFVCWARPWQSGYNPVWLPVTWLSMSTREDFLTVLDRSIQHHKTLNYTNKSQIWCSMLGIEWSLNLTISDWAQRVSLGNAALSPP